MRGLLKEVSDRYSFTDVLAKKKSYTSAQEKTIRKGKSYEQLGDLVKD